MYEHGIVALTSSCSICMLNGYMTTAGSGGGSKGGMPEGKDPELDSEVAKKKDPFFKEVKKRT